MDAKECKDAWNVVKACYDNTRIDNSPNVTLYEIIEELGLPKTKEIFAVVAALKKSDGRISPQNRSYLNTVPINEDCMEYSSSNPMMYAGLDYIHTAHIDNLVTALRNYEKSQNELKISKYLGALPTHWLVEIYKLENGRYLAIDNNSSNGETVTAWYCEKDGSATAEPAFKVKEIYRQIDETQSELIGFERD